MVTLRAYQARALEQLDARIAAGVHRILVVAPTGSGKTVIMAQLSARAVSGGRHVLLVAHRRELIQQTYQKLLDAGLEESQVGVLMASDARRRPVAPVQVASIDTLRHRPKPMADVVVVDECHRELAKSYADLRAAYPGATHLGFTATPFRADGRGLGEFYEEILVAARVRELIAEGYLVEPRVLTVPESSLPDVGSVHVRAGDYDQRELDQAANRAALVGNIVEHWQKHASDLRTVVFAVSVEHSKHIADRFRAAGVAAEHIDGTTNTPDRDAILSRLERGMTRVVVNCAILSEGWDQPSVKCAILARPTKSTGLYLQQAGRILRPWQDTRAVILDHAGCAREHGLPHEDRAYDLSPPPRTPREAGAPPVRVCEGCYAVVALAAHVCPECGRVLVEERQVPAEQAGELVEAARTSAPYVTRRPTPRPPHDPPNTRRAFFEQCRALARARRQTAAWAEARFVERYGAPPPQAWIDHAWGAL